MADISRAALFGKLNSLAYKSIEGATVFCKLRGNPYVELVHWVHQILQQPASDLHLILRAFDIDAAKLARDITDSLDRLPRGSTSISDLSRHVEDATERAWVWATLRFGEPKIRTGHLIVALLRQGYRVGSVDLDARQGTLSRYVENRQNFGSQEGMTLPNPVHHRVQRSTLDSVAAARFWGVVR